MLIVETMSQTVLARSGQILEGKEVNNLIEQKFNGLNF